LSSFVQLLLKVVSALGYNLYNQVYSNLIKPDFLNMDSVQQSQAPSVITLDKNNSIKILIQYNELIQKSGAFDLKEADLIKRAIDVLIYSATDSEINEIVGINLLIQGIHKGQKHGGTLTLNDASLLHKVILYITNIVIPEIQNSPSSNTPEPSVLETIKEAEPNVVYLKSNTPVTSTSSVPPVTSVPSVTSVKPIETNIQATVTKSIMDDDDDDDDDLSSLSQAVPLLPRVV
jgi:hypothetical protein